MTAEDWQTGFNRCVGMMLEGYGLDELSDDGKPVVDDTLLVLINAHTESLPFLLPTHPLGTAWELLLDTSEAEGAAVWQDTFPLSDHSLCLLKLQSNL
jgi:glycogen operon protein